MAASVLVVVVLIVLVTLLRPRRAKPSLPGAPPKTVAPPRESKLAASLRRTRGSLGVARAAHQVEEGLIMADAGVRIAGSIVEKLRAAKVPESESRAFLVREVATILSVGDARLHADQDVANVWLITGVNGSGKTTSTAKLAKSQLDLGRSVVLAACDTFRAAAVDQLGIWADRLGVHMVRHIEGGDPGAVVFDAIAYAKARGIDIVIADTAGRLHTKTNLMAELSKIRRVAERESGSVAETLLVLDATVGQNGLAQARTFLGEVQITGVVLTKLDGSAKGGVVLAIHDELGVPVKALGVGEGLDDLEVFDPEAFASALLS